VLKKILITSLILLFNLPLFAIAQSKSTIAVLSLDPLGMSEMEADVLSNRLRTLLVNIGDFEVVDRSRMEDILKEQGFQQTGCTSDECVVEAGKLLGVQKMLAGSIGKFGTVFTLELRIIDVETSKIESSASYDYKIEMENLLLEGAETALRQLLDLAEGDQLSDNQRRRLYGVLEISSNPSGATILLNDEENGLTPKTISFVSPGYHRLVIEKEDYKPFDKQIKITHNKTNTISAELQYKYGYLEINSNIPGAEIYINYQFVGKDKFIGEKMDPGDYLIETKHDFYNTYTEKVNLTAQDTILKNLKLVPAFGYLNLNGNPQNAAVSIFNDKYQNTYAMSQVRNLQLQAGFYDLEINAPYYYPFRDRIKIKGEDKYPLEINLDFGGDDIAKLKNQRKWLNLSSLAGLGLTAGSMLIANSMYTQYKNANKSSEAEDYRKKTELFDNIAIGLSVVTVGISTYSIWKWYKESQLKRKLGLK